MHHSRKDCKTFETIVTKDKKMKKFVMLHNMSVTAAEEAFPGQLEKEKDHVNENVTAVQDLKKVLVERS
jgi:hypothetical protein